MNEVENGAQFLSRSKYHRWIIGNIKVPICCLNYVLMGDISLNMEPDLPVVVTPFNFKLNKLRLTAHTLLKSLV